MQTPPPSQKWQNKIFVPIDAQCSVTYAKKIPIFQVFSLSKIVISCFWDLDFYEPDSETLTKAKSLPNTIFNKF